MQKGWFFVCVWKCEKFSEIKSNFFHSFFSAFRINSRWFKIWLCLKVATFNCHAKVFLRTFLEDSEIIEKQNYCVSNLFKFQVAFNLITSSVWIVKISLESYVWSDIWLRQAPPYRKLISRMFIQCCTSLISYFVMKI